MNKNKPVLLAGLPMHPLSRPISGSSTAAACPSRLHRVHTHSWENHWAPLTYTPSSSWWRHPSWWEGTSTSLCQIQQLIFLKKAWCHCSWQTEADDDPADVDVIYVHLSVPVLFLFAQTETLRMDRSTAETLAWRLRGEIGLVLIRRCLILTCWHEKRKTIEQV